MRSLHVPLPSAACLEASAAMPASASCSRAHSACDREATPAASNAGSSGAARPSSSSGGRRRRPTLTMLDSASSAACCCAVAGREMCGAQPDAGARSPLAMLCVVSAGTPPARTAAPRVSDQQFRFPHRSVPLSQNGADRKTDHHSVEARTVARRFRDNAATMKLNWETCMVRAVAPCGHDRCGARSP